jgi:Protein of unknown function (DUF3619)
MNQVEFAYRVRQALNEGTDRIPYRVAVRLEQARRAALARQKAVAEKPLWTPALRFGGRRSAVAVLDEPSGGWLWLRRVALLVLFPIAILGAGFGYIYQWHEDQLIAERANLDLAVLLDDTPIDTYADKGFSVMIRDEQGI